MTKTLTRWDDLAPSPGSNGVSKRTLTGVGGATLVRVEIPAGTEAGRHSHPHEQFVQVVSGSGALTTEQGTAAFATGSLFHFPADVWHAARFDTDTVLVETNLAG